MSKILCVILVLSIVFLCGCSVKNVLSADAAAAFGETVSSNDGSFPAETASKSDDDIDLTVLSTTMVYAEVYCMLTAPADYIGRTVKMSGRFSVYEDEASGMRYFSCVIDDATACCQQGLEFVLSGDYTYPDDYPALDTEITVTGRFETYEESGLIYCHLADAEFVDI